MNLSANVQPQIQMQSSVKIGRPVLRYHGGKFRMAKWIISHFPKHKVYVEPFGGGASVLMQKPRSYAEIYNDVWDIVYNVFYVLRDPVLAQNLERQIRLTPFSRTEFESCGDVQIDQINDLVEKARKTIFRSFAGFGSASTNAKYATGFRANSNRSGSTPAHDWANYPDYIQLFTNRLAGVVLEKRDFRKVIPTHDSPSTLFYLDPPYVHSTRNFKRGNASYAHELSDQDHIDLAEILNKISGMAVISGYRSDLYDHLYNHWTRIDYKTFADGAVGRIESIWLSPNCINKQLRPTLFNQYK